MKKYSDLAFCRICLARDQSFISVLQCVNGYKVSDLMYELIGEMMLIDERIPDIICVNCSNILVIASKLRQQAIESESNMQQYVLDLANEVELKTEIQESVRHSESEPQPRLVIEKLQIERITESPVKEVDVSKNDDDVEFFADLIDAEDTNSMNAIADEVDEKKQIIKPRIDVKTTGLSLDSLMAADQIIDFDDIQIAFVDRDESKITVLEDLQQISSKTKNNELLEITPEELERACCMCKTVWATVDELKEHAKTHSERHAMQMKIESLGEQEIDSQLRCELCLKSPYRLSKHRMRLYLRKTVICDNCGAGFSKPSQLRQHIRIKHEPLKRVSCSICAKEVWDIYFKTHVKTHFSDNQEMQGRFPCKICGKVFSTKSKLGNHSRVHLSDENLPYACSICPKKFRNCSNLLAHIRVHENNRCYSCDYCHLTFIHPTDRNRHMKIHTGERPHKCQLCSQAYIKKYDLTQHMNKSHPGQLPYECVFCLKKFMHISELPQHMMMIHPDIEFDEADMETALPN